MAHEIQSAPSRQHQPGGIWKLNVTDKLSEMIFAVDFLKTLSSTRHTATPCDTGTVDAGDGGVTRKWTEMGKENKFFR